MPLNLIKEYRFSTFFSLRKTIKIRNPLGVSFPETRACHPPIRLKYSQIIRISRPVPSLQHQIMDWKELSISVLWTLHRGCSLFPRITTFIKRNKKSTTGDWEFESGEDKCIKILASSKLSCAWSSVVQYINGQRTWREFSQKKNFKVLTNIWKLFRQPNN